MSRRLALLTLTALASASVAACTGTPDYPPLPPDPPREVTDAGTEPGVSVPPSSTISYELVVGGTVPISPGEKVGYSLTATAPKTYQLRWTGDQRTGEMGYSHFYGAVWTTGRFTAFARGEDGTPCACALEKGDQVDAPVAAPGGGERINWSTVATIGWDGFTFSVDTEPIYFDVFADNARRPTITEFPAFPGGAPTSPETSPFGMSSGVRGADGGSDAPPGDAPSDGD
jgi:hypothetical protein